MVPHREERRGRLDAHELVGLGDGRVRRCDRDGEDHPHGAAVPGHRAGGACGGTGGDAVVDDDRGPSRQVLAPAATAEPLEPDREALGLAPLDGGQLRLGDAGPGHEGAVQHAGAALADRPHRDLGLPRHAELADHDHVERQGEVAGDLRGHHHPAAGQAEHHRVSAAMVLELPGQAPAGVLAVGEHQLVSIAAGGEDSPVVTAIFRGSGSSLNGTVTFSTPSEKSAAMAPSSAFSGRAIRR